MAVGWNKYGRIWISAGMVLTGVVWYERSNTVIRGEDMAEVRAAAEDVKVARHTQYEELPNYITLVYTNWSVTTNWTQDVTFYKPTSGADYVNNYITLSQYTFTFTIDNYTNWQSALAMLSINVTNVPPGASTYGAVFGVINGGVTSPPVASPWNIPLRVQYNLSTPPAHEELAPNFNLAGSVETTNANWSLLSGDSATFKVRLATVPTNVVITVTTNGFNVYTNISSLGRVDDFMRWDVLYTQSMCVVRDSFTNTEDNVYWLAPSAVMADGTVAATYDPTWELFSSVEDAYGVLERQWILSAPAHAVDAIGTLASRIPDASVHYVNGTTNIVLPVAKWFDSPGETTGMSDTLNGGNWWTHGGLGTNVFGFRCERWTDGSSVPVTDKRVTTQNLYAVKTALNMMTRTVKLYEPFNVAYTNVVRTEYTNLYHVLSTGMPASSLPYFEGDAFEQQMCEGVAFKQEVATETGWISSLAGQWANSLWSLNCVNVQAIQTGEGGADYWDSDYYFSGQLTFHQARGCTLDYPSDFALTNGYVDKIEVYAVIEMKSMTWSGNYVYDNDPKNTERDVRCGSLTNVYGWSLGTGASVCPLPAMPSGELVHDGTYWDFVDPAGHMTQAVLTKIGEWNSPTQRPVFNIGVTSGWLPYWVSLKQRETIDSADGEIWSVLLEHHWYYDWGNTLSVTKIIEVVTWKWKHLNDSNPYVPTPFTPEWAVTNAP